MTSEDGIETAGAAPDFRGLFRDLRTTLKAGGPDTLQSLQAVVELLADHFQSDVCSLYQFDEARGELFLRATKGLRAEAIGRTVLAIGQGLVGTIAETRRPLALENAQADARFSFRPETGEEIYHSFLGVPLIRARTLLGVLVIQHRDARRYPPEAVEDCETVGQFLSEMLQQVALSPEAGPDARPQGTRHLTAVPLSPGLAMGEAVFYLKDIVISRWRVSDPAPELRRVGEALAALEAALETHSSLGSQADRETQELLEADLMLARDRGWRQKIEAAIGQGFSAEAAVQKVREDLRARMKAVTNEYIRARLLDLDDLSHRLLVELTGQQGRDLTEALGPNSILVCRSLGTAEFLKIAERGLAGLVVVDATRSSHLAILAASMKIPMLGQVPDALTELREADAVVLDAVNGQLIVRPSGAVLAQFRAHSAAKRDRETWDPDLPCESRDGVGFGLMANAGLLLDLEELDRFKTVGVGLYRTEMAFLIRESLPSVTEQAELYRRIFDRMGERPVVFRTLDVGSDKPLPYFEEHKVEANPALGWRAIRVGLDHPDLLRDQCRALLLAADGRPLSVMFPMISEVEEFEAARTLLQETLEAHRAEGGPPPERLSVGVMIEVPALLWDLERLFDRADFASVGTNDLFQFITAADRNNPKTDRRFEIFRPAHLRILAGIAETAGRAGKPVSVCGELAGQPLGALALAGCGFRTLSMNTACLPRIKASLRALDLARVEEQVQALARQDGASARAEIAALARELGLNLD